MSPSTTDVTCRRRRKSVSVSAVDWRQWVPCLGMALCSWLSFVDRQVLGDPVADDPQGHRTDARRISPTPPRISSSPTRCAIPIWGSILDYVGLRVGMLLGGRHLDGRAACRTRG